MKLKGGRKFVLRGAAYLQPNLLSTLFSHSVPCFPLYSSPSPLCCFTIWHPKFSATWSLPLSLLLILFLLQHFISKQNSVLMMKSWNQAVESSILCLSLAEWLNLWGNPCFVISLTLVGCLMKEREDPSQWWVLMFWISLALKSGCVCMCVISLW